MTYDIFEKQAEGKYTYWKKLMMEYTEYAKLVDHPLPEDFVQWMKERWGMAVVYNGDGYGAYYSVVDEKKHLMFKIKHG
jgi:hypothetical protein